jgi:hypothetical protein
MNAYFTVDVEQDCPPHRHLAGHRGRVAAALVDA